MKHGFSYNGKDFLYSGTLEIHGTAVISLVILFAETFYENVLVDGERSCRYNWLPTPSLYLHGSDILSEAETHGRLSCLFPYL